MKCSACAVVALCAWLDRVPALRSRGAAGSGQTNNGTLLTFQPDFKMCDEQALCRAGETYELDLLMSVADRARRIAASGATPVLLQIGLDGLRNPAKFCDVDLYQELSLILNLSDFRSVLVDAKSEQNDQVWSNVAKTKLDAAKVRIVNGFLMGKCEADHMVMYSFSPRIQEVFGVGAEHTGWVSGASKLRPIQSLRGYVREVMRADNPFAEQWKAMGALTDNELFEYIEEKPYRCFTPSALLGEAGVDAGSLAMVVVDAEGEDWNIVGAFLEMRGFKPGVLQWEGVYSGSAEQVSALRRLGFRVGNVAQHNGGDSFNILAVQTLS